MNTYSFGREEWKSVKLGEGFINKNRLEVSNHGRVRSFNKLSNGRLIKGSRINGYAIVRIKLFKPRDEKATLKLQELQAATSTISKNITEINKALKNATITAVERKAFNEKLGEEMERLDKSQRKYRSFHKQEVRSRTVYFAALVHRMIAERFLPAPATDQTVVAHLDHDKLNNKITNLKWMSMEENIAHQQTSPHVIADKENRTSSGLSTAGRSKLTITKVMYLKKLLKEGKPLRSLAKQFKVTETQIIRIKKEENWASVKAAE